MEQNQEMNLPNQVDKVEVWEAIVSAPDSVVEDKNAGAAGGGEAGKQKKMGSAILMAVLVILALGGVAFGAFAMVTSGSEIAKKDDEISKLKVQVGQADGTKAELETETITITNPDGSTTEIAGGGVTSNPVISAEAPVTYTIGFTSSNYLGGENGAEQLMLSVRDGEINNCAIFEVTDAYSKRLSRECQINGLSGEVYKIVEIGEGQANQDDVIGFVMTDGTVQYMPFYESMRSGSYTIKGTMNVGGFVRDVIGDVNVWNTEVPAGGYGTTIFVLGDGSFVKYDSSMLR